MLVRIKEKRRKLISPEQINGFQVEIIGAACVRRERDKRKKRKKKKIRKY